MKNIPPDFITEEVTFRCNIGVMALVAFMMRNYIVDLIEQTASAEDFKMPPHFMLEVVRINNEMISFVNNFDFKKEKGEVAKVTIQCVPRAMAAYGILLDNNLENIWMIFESMKIPILPNGKKEIIKFIRQMRDCLGVSFDWRSAN